MIVLEDAVQAAIEESLQVTIDCMRRHLKCLAKYAHWYNSGVNVIRGYPVTSGIILRSHSQERIHAFYPGYVFFVSLTHTRIIWEGGTSIEKMPPMGWPVEIT